MSRAAHGGVETCGRITPYAKIAPPMPRIKGAAIRGLLRFVKSSALDGGIPGVIDALPTPIRPFYESQIVADDWYPYEAYTELLDVMTQIHGRGEDSFLEVLGRHAARHDVGGIFKVISVLASFEKIMSSASSFWSRYCDTGTFEILEVASGHGVGRLTEFPTVSRHHTVLLVGWIEGIALAAGAKSPAVTLTRAIHLGDDRCEYEMRWTS